MSNIFKAYDVRGIYPDELNEEIAERIAAATVKFLNVHSTSSGQAKKLVVGEDARVSSPSLRRAVLEGATKAGCDVYYIGRCTTPLFYFSVNQLGADGGIMITASHNPSQYNGLKIVRYGGDVIYSDSGLKEIQKLMESDLTSEQNGFVEEASVLDRYVDFLIEESGVKDKKLKFVLDTSNGVAPVVLEPLLERLNFNPALLNFDIDGNFPGHSPDISKKENLEQLKNKILETGADVGFAFDGDADRLVVLDERGEKLMAEFIVELLFKDKAGLFKKPKVVYDLRFSRTLKELIGKNGFWTPVGYPFIRSKMKRVDADLGGEFSGHFAFKEMNYAESAILAMLKVLNILARNSKPLSELIRPFKKYFNSGEVNIELNQSAKIKNQNGNVKFKILETLKNKYSDGKQNFLDGVTVEYPSWWFNTRFSHTEPLVRLIVEAKDEAVMKEKAKELESVIKTAM